ncbi:male-specific lethal 3 homolog [Hermetia illucens]|uniref:male-specific lethal 3 homolog n=1 Tax=Hermetia illucens TaxID=343691 RepID=UPI0018CC2005|nr:male-specific lethal 3 homolog [Hermetia illucens]
MVSTRGIRYKFSEGERVLCYEPDPTKAKVLYDSKVLGVVETKDKRGKKIIQYMIHFQGWNSSWDRRVNSDFVLKDTEENRQLQRDLAEKAQLQLAAYLYRREKRKRSRGSNSTRNRVSSEDGSSCSTFDRNEREDLMRDEGDSESSSIESGADEDRLYLQVGEQLKQILDFDREMIVRRNKQHILPAELPAVTILENFVKHSALKLVFSPQTPNEGNRRRNPQQKREINFEKLNQTVSLLKEVADGLRIYLDFILKDHLLYNEEKEQGAYVLSEENLKNFTYIASEKFCPDFLNLKFERSDTPAGSEFSEPHSTFSDVSHPEDNARRRLRSYRAETEPDAVMDPLNFFMQEANLGKPEGTPKDSSHTARLESSGVLKQEPGQKSEAGTTKTDNTAQKIDSTSSKHETCISSIASTSSGGSTPRSNILSGNIDFTKTIPPLNSAVSLKTREFLQNVFSWQIVPSNAPVEASMIFGAVHLARLTIKLPDFLNATHMSDEKLARLAPLLDSFFKYLESHKEWFGEHNYKDKSPPPNPAQSPQATNAPESTQKGS